MFQYYPNMQRYTQDRTARTKRMTKKTQRSVTSSCVRKVLHRNETYLCLFVCLLTGSCQAIATFSQVTGCKDLFSVSSPRSCMT